MTHPYWPLFDVEVVTPLLRLVAITDDRAMELVKLAGRGVHDPVTMPFQVPWTDEPSPRREHESLRYYWRTRVEATADAWHLPLAVIVDGAAIGSTDLVTSSFPITKEFTTGSWLGLEFHGRGLGKELRVATLTLGFLGFGADLATTSAFHDNAGSLGVTRSLGYVETGRRRDLRRDGTDVCLTFEMTRQHFLDRVARDDIELRGTERAREFLKNT